MNLLIKFNFLLCLIGSSLASYPYPQTLTPLANDEGVILKSKSTTPEFALPKQLPRVTLQDVVPNIKSVEIPNETYGTPDVRIPATSYGVPVQRVPVPITRKYGAPEPRSIKANEAPIKEANTQMATKQALLQLLDQNELQKQSQTNDAVVIENNAFQPKTETSTLDGTAFEIPTKAVASSKFLDMPKLGYGLPNVNVANSKTGELPRTTYEIPTAAIPASVDAVLLEQAEQEKPNLDLRSLILPFRFAHFTVPSIPYFPQIRRHPMIYGSS